MSCGRLAIIIPALPDFYARYPDIQLELGVSDRPIDLVTENVDCVVRAGQITDQSLVARKIGEFYIMASASPAYLKLHGRPEHPGELEDAHQVIRYGSSISGKLYTLKMHKDGEIVEVNGHHKLAVSDSIAGVAAGLAGLGILFSLTFLVQTHISSGTMEPLFPGWCAVIRDCRRPSFWVNLLSHWLLFAWLGICAFPYLGELP